MSDFLKEQMKSEEFRREFEALEPDCELVLRGDVDPRNLCYLIDIDGREFNDYQRGYNDGVIAAYWLTRKARKMEAEPVVHAHWIPVEGGGFRDRVVTISECSNCGGQVSHHGYACPDKWCKHCGAHMDECFELRTCYCPICDKHFEVRSNDSMGDCAECGHHVVLHRRDEE